MATWTLTYGGVTQSAAAWGITNLKRTRKSATTGKVTFEVPMQGDAAGPFAIWQPVSIQRNGVQWFVGWVTSPPRKLTANAESLLFEISDAWYWLEKTVFQQQWVQITTSGGALVSGTTTQSETILGQSLDGVKMNSGQVMLEVLLYAQYAYQMIPFPTTVNLATHLPNPPAVAAPFQIGALTPSIVVPYIQVRDKSCADILRLLMKFSPDAVAWIDCSTTPPTLNIAQRGGLNGNTIKVVTSNGPLGSDGYGTTGFNPTPRYDLQVPVVVAKFLEDTSINGTSYASTVVQVYPAAPGGVNAEAWASQPRAWVQTIDLIGGHTTSQTTSLTTQARPTTAGSVVALPWALSKMPQLTAVKTIPYVGDELGQPVFDTANMGVAFLNTYINPKDPLNTSNPNDITISGTSTNDCPQLVNELVAGNWGAWLQNDPNDLDKANVTIEVHLNYSGTDPATQALFWQDPTDPTNIITDGSGVLIMRWTGDVTNGSTDTYSQLTSWAAGEPIPTGFAQALYESLAQLHCQGSLTIVEQECSDRLPPGTVFNTVDGLALWQAMNALVISVTEDIETGTTNVEFGPPAFLSLQEMEQLFRANLGILPAWKLDQRTTGKLATGATVTGDKTSGVSWVEYSTVPPATSDAPWGCAVVKENGVVGVKVNVNSILANSPAQGDVRTVVGLGTFIPISASDDDFVYLEQPVAQSASGAITPIGNATVYSGNSGDSFDPSEAAWAPDGEAYLANNGASQPGQTFFRVLLATTKVPAATPGNPNPLPVATQVCSLNLLIENVFIDSLPAILAYPAASVTPAAS